MYIIYPKYVYIFICSKDVHFLIEEYAHVLKNKFNKNAIPI